MKKLGKYLEFELIYFSHYLTVFLLVPFLILDKNKNKKGIKKTPAGPSATRTGSLWLIPMDSPWPEAATALAR